MKLSSIFVSTTLSLLFLSSWGFYSHKLINETAIYSLPKELMPFFKLHQQTIKEYAVNPDKRVHVDSNEAVKHYIDLDRHQLKDSLYLPWYQVEKVHSPSYLLARGIIPWQIKRTYEQLKDAFKQKDSKRIIKLAADLGHYAADAHVPLHTSSNYNGQFSNQTGIHALWETRIPEQYALQYNLIVGKAQYIDDVLAYSWEIINHSHQLVDTVLQKDIQVKNTLKNHRHKSHQFRNNTLQNSYSKEYVQSYHTLLDGMVEKQLRSSILTVASLWYSAWIEAGQPVLRLEM